LTGSLVDFHCHLDLYPDFEALVRECNDARIHTLAVTTTPRAWERNFELAARTDYVLAALGLHPQLVGSHAHEIDLLESLLPKARYVGEVGLDSGPQYFKTLEAQKQVFERVLKACNRQGGKVLSVHSVRSATAVLDMVEKHVSFGRARIVLHWFTGSLSEAKRAVDLGCYFSVNAQMAASERTGKVVASLPDDRILTETDGPFAKTFGEPSRPKHARESVQAIARLRNQPETDIEALVSENFNAITSPF
jgi:TatD DNase family protein